MKRLRFGFHTRLNSLPSKDVPETIYCPDSETWTVLLGFVSLAGPACCSSPPITAVSSLEPCAATVEQLRAVPLENLGTHGRTRLLESNCTDIPLVVQDECRTRAALAQCTLSAGVKVMARVRRGAPVLAGKIEKG
eukprot:6208091-Pleurochrysis_carterae.AAC.3